jgi:hypothetical protein
MLKVNKNMTNVAPKRATVMEEKLLLLLVAVFS